VCRVDVLRMVLGGLGADRRRARCWWVSETSGLIYGAGIQWCVSGGGRIRWKLWKTSLPPQIGQRVPSSSVGRRAGTGQSSSSGSMSRSDSRIAARRRSRSSVGAADRCYAAAGSSSHHHADRSPAHDLAALRRRRRWLLARPLTGFGNLFEVQLD